ncbi:MAG TPA: PTS sugar transporter subunit IIA [Burkholderiaceae bacterium]|jgi:PTS system nitrogen regulatory IIA component|nr:PTS sugar transporter subunit IIA [Burkholderiaceae bacterium]
MNLLSKLLPLSNVELDVGAHDKLGALIHASRLFEETQGLDAARILECLTAREELGSTGLGKEVAIPHGRLRGLKRAVVGILRLHDPIAFDSPDGLPVRLLVVLLVPEHATQQHLEILSELAQMLSEPSMREQLLTAAQPAALLATVAAWEPIRPAA